MNDIPGCAVCGDFCLDDYMVYYEVWKASGMGLRDVCHLDCLSARLTERRGHGLKGSDFPANVPANRAIIFGYILGRMADMTEDIPHLPPVRCRAPSREEMNELWGPPPVPGEHRVKAGNTVK